MFKVFLFLVYLLTFHSRLSPTALQETSRCQGGWISNGLYCEYTVPSGLIGTPEDLCNALGASYQNEGQQGKCVKLATIIHSNSGWGFGGGLPAPPPSLK